MLDRGLAARPQLLVRCSASQTIPHTSTISKRNFMPCCFLGGSKSGRKPAPACSSMTGAKSTNPVDDQMIDNNEVMNGEEMCIAVRLGLPPLLSVESLEREQYQEAHTFNSFASWVIPGRLLQGRYPYIEPSRCVRRGIGEAQIKELLEATVNTFICLQAELPPQERLQTGGVNGFLPYKPIASMIASTMGTPTPIEMTGGIRNDHLNKFLPPKRQNGTENGTNTFKSAPKLEFLHSPIVDLDIPGFDQVELLLSEIEKRLENGAVIYLHCWGGRGRAGTIAACLLAKLYGIRAEEALKRIQWSFETRGDDKAYSPETMQQRQFVRDYAECFLKRPSKSKR